MSTSATRIHRDTYAAITGGLAHLLVCHRGSRRHRWSVCNDTESTLVIDDSDVTVTATEHFNIVAFVVDPDVLMTGHIR